jgi:hypothetical protein
VKYPGPQVALKRIPDVLKTVLKYWLPLHSTVLLSVKYPGPQVALKRIPDVLKTVLKYWLPLHSTVLLSVKYPGPQCLSTGYLYKVLSSSTSA